MQKLRLLIIDDDNSQVQSLLDALREILNEPRHNAIQVFETIRNDKISALEAISNEEFDFAIIDLKLSDDKTKTEGNEIIREIKKKMRFPVVVLSNYPDNLDEDISTPSDVFLIKERTATPYRDLMIEILALFNTGISTLFAKDGFLLSHINRSLNELFWERMAKDWIYLTNKISAEDLRTKIVAKQLTTLLKEEMQLGKFVSKKSDPFEMYLVPPIRKHYYTGDIITKDDSFYIIISPACDMEIRENDKPDVENVVVSKLTHLKEHDYSKCCWKEGAFQNNKTDKINNLIKSKKGEYHLLPPFKNEMGFIIDFANIMSVPYDDLRNFKRKASITEPFLKNILSRFSNHYNRLGQPDFDEDKLLEEIKTL